MITERMKKFAGINESANDKEWDLDQFWIDVVKEGGISRSLWGKIVFAKDYIEVKDEDGNTHILGEDACYRLQRKYNNGKPFVFDENYRPDDKTVRFEDLKGGVHTFYVS